MKGVIYARYSNGPDQTERSIEGQVADCEAYAAQNGIEITNVYADRHISGRSVDGRFEFQKMIKDAEKGLFDCVIVWKIDRFGRDRYDIAVHKARLKRTGVKLLYSKESIPDGPEGIILESVLEGLAEYYSVELGQKVARGFRENAKKGIWTFPLCIGYMRDAERRIVQDPVRAPIILHAFELYAGGSNIKSVMEYLQSAGIKGRFDAPIGKNATSMILRNRHYLGEFEIQGITFQDVEPIVPVELFERVQSRLPSPHMNAAGKAKVNYLLSGKCFCAECGSMFVGMASTGRSGRVYNYYKCAKRKNYHTCGMRNLRKEKLEELVLRHTMEDMLTEEMIDQLVDKVMEVQEKELGSEQAEKRAINAGLAEVKKKTDNIITIIENGTDMVAPLLERLKGLEEERLRLEEELTRVAVPVPKLKPEAVRAWLLQFRDGDVTDETFCRRLIDTFVKRINIGKTDIVITYNVTDGSGADTNRYLSQFESYTQQLPYGVPIVHKGTYFLRIPL